MRARPQVMEARPTAAPANARALRIDRRRQPPRNAAPSHTITYREVWASIVGSRAVGKRFGARTPGDRVAVLGFARSIPPSTWLCPTPSSTVPRNHAPLTQTSAMSPGPSDCARGGHRHSPTPSNGATEHSRGGLIVFEYDRRSRTA